jgi:hypothetical protein
MSLSPAPLPSRFRRRSLRGGEDKQENMQWQGKKEALIKDEFEREACAMKRKRAC